MIMTQDVARSYPPVALARSLATDALGGELGRSECRIAYVVKLAWEAAEVMEDLNPARPCDLDGLPLLPMGRNEDDRARTKPRAKRRERV